MNAVVLYLTSQRDVEHILHLTPGSYKNIMFRERLENKDYRILEMDLYVFTTSTRNIYFEMLNCLAFIIYDRDSQVTVYDFEVLPLEFSSFNFDWQHVKIKVKGFELTERGI